MAEITRQQLMLALIQAGERPRLAGLDLSGLKLTTLNLSKADLKGADMSGASLEWADLGEADYQGQYHDAYLVALGSAPQTCRPARPMEDTEDAVDKGSCPQGTCRVRLPFDAGGRPASGNPVGGGEQVGRAVVPLRRGAPRRTKPAPRQSGVHPHGGGKAAPRRPRGPEPLPLRPVRRDLRSGRTRALHRFGRAQADHAQLLGG